MMKKSSRKMLCGMIMAALFSGVMGSSVYAADMGGNNNEGSVIIGNMSDSAIVVDYENVYGYMDYDENDPVSDKEANGGNVQIYNASADSSICIYGGLAMNNNSKVSKLGDAEANGNTVYLEKLTFHKGSENGEIIGGAAISRPNGNTGHVYANENKLILKDSNIISGTVIGGYVSRPGASSKHAQVNGNSVEISNSAVVSEIYGGNAYVYGAGNSKNYDDDVKEAITEAKNNYIAVGNGSVIGGEDDLRAIYGSYIYYYSSGNTAEATKNTVQLTDSTVYGDVFGTYVQSFQCSTGNENSNGTDTVLHAEDNHVSIQNNQVLGTVKGAYAYDDSNSLNAVSKTISNSVEISGTSSVTGSIYGADNYSRNSGGKAVDGEVRNNYVSIDGDINVKDGTIYGEADIPMLINGAEMRRPGMSGSGIIL